MLGTMEGTIKLSFLYDEAGGNNNKFHQMLSNRNRRNSHATMKTLSPKRSVYKLRHGFESPAAHA